MPGKGVGFFGFCDTPLELMGGRIVVGENDGHTHTHYIYIEYLYNIYTYIYIHGISICDLTCLSFIIFF